MAKSWRSFVSGGALTALIVTAFVYVLMHNRTSPPPYGAGTNDWIGRAAPDFTLPAMDGTPVTLSSLKGHVVVLDLWATWCPPCVEELPKNAEIAARYADRGVKFYAVNLGDPFNTVKAFLDRQKLNPPVLLDADTRAGQAYDVTYIPLLVVLDANGKIVQRDNVSPGDVDATLPKWIESALKSGQAS